MCFQRTDGKPAVYLANNDETPRQIANKLEIDVKALVNLNKRFLNGLTQHSRLKSNSKLRIPSQDGSDSVSPVSSQAITEIYDRTCFF